MKYMNTTTSKLMESLRCHDLEAYNHCVRVADLAVEIAVRYGVKQDLIPMLRTAALLHDIGKLCVPQTILQKPGKLTSEEYAQVKVHTEYGKRILKSFGYPCAICDVAYSHHERPDGTGYHGDTDIPIFARIVCAADCMDVMLHGRCYQAHKDPDAIREDLQHNAGRQFDQQVADVCMSLMAGK